MSLKLWWCPGVGLNHRHCDFQSHALPTELPRHKYKNNKITFIVYAFL